MNGPSVLVYFTKLFQQIHELNNYKYHLFNLKKYQETFKSIIERTYY